MDAFKDEQTHPLVLLRKYLSMFGLDALEWEPEVIKRSVEDETGSSIARVNFIKLMSAISVANHDAFWKDWQSFHFLCQGLNNLIPSAAVMHSHSVGQMMTAVDIANTIREDLGSITNTPSFTESVARYVAAQALEEGVWYLPEPLEFANKYCAGFMQKCERCENIEEEQEDGLCSYCTDRYNCDGLQKLDPCRDLKKVFDSTKVKPFTLYPYAGVSRRLTEALTKKDVVLGETQDDICASKLLTGLEYMSYRRSQLRKQSEAA